MSYHVFVDFDGTITVDDVGYKFFKLFVDGRAEPIVQKYRRGEATALECLQTECDLYNENPMPTEKVNEFIDSQTITPGFVDFVKYCKANEIKLTVLSAGFDFYIKRILGRLGLTDIELFATPTRVEQGRLHPEFVRYDKNVCTQCVDCKGARIRELTARDEVSVFIGDGHSDSHGAEQADIIYAKSFLAEYLDDRGINYFSYANFHDIMKSFQVEIDQGKES